MRTLAKNFLEYASRQSRTLIVISGAVLVLGLGILDAVTGYEVGLSVFYLAPICLVTWFAGRGPGLLIAVASAITWLTADIAAGHAFSHVAISVWNATIRFGFFGVTLIILNRFHLVIEAQAKTIRDLEQARDEIRILSGFIPICSRCKKIRNDRGYWEQLESYIRQHSEAEFTHSICPDCARILYPDLYNQREREKDPMRSPGG